MCVDKHHYKCCSCFSMTTGTLILGALYLLSSIGDAISGYWFAFALSVVITLLFVMVLVKPHDINIRKLLYYIVSILTTIQLVGLVVVFIFLLVTDDWIAEACSNYSSDYTDQLNCLDYARTGMIIAMCCLMVIYSLLAFCTVQILYYGWKEQVHIAQERQGHD